LFAVVKGALGRSCLNMVGIDLFAGAGGMSIGALDAGVNIALAVESDKQAAKTYQANHPDVAVFDDDIRKLTQARLRKIKRGNNGTIVFGGPPCQGFSYSNQRTRKAENPDNWLFLEFLRIVKDWKADWVVFENVKGITNTERGMFLRLVVDALNKCGYTTLEAVLDAADYGVPQHRERLFVVAARHFLPTFPPPNSRASPVSVWDAIHDLPHLENGALVDWQSYRRDASSDYARARRRRRSRCSGHLVTRNAAYVLARYRHIPQGGNWEDIPAALMRNYADPNRCHTGIYHRLSAHKPSIVIGNYRKNMLIHPWQHRGLSVREAARIQSFPDAYVFSGSVGFQQQQVGNAVPPLLAAAVFREIVKVAGAACPRAEGANRDE
jgi:DNA (cytosine-5)-methyltransferase 1